ncbi:D-tyrosyl-tRNA(Tyr) deacylase [Arcticibacter svalbardensis MN12-7]|uniref:D-aminoacyl-tRNA deacylase n=1 Tax=Arcticibacter svalbardensis MN12-7 TaxID=1150600 RepID=R9GT18_9SPHI|nr:D-aminoacyl-tRNA deacylase [Arcticibacter svalbardensis]EOR95007.1 D-tyrosyl-tRNA(Tyr) deacylase [Arcticibacter svalbardensis MN12-7]
MRAVIQRVTEASCSVDGEITGVIGPGLLVFLGIEDPDTAVDIKWLAQKIVNLRIFSDAEDKMNLSLMDIDGGILLISQFTLFASTKKGNRPGFTRAAKPKIAIPLYEHMKEELEVLSGKKTQSGIFGADMKIKLLNDGPVTLIMNTRDKDNF